MTESLDKPTVLIVDDLPDGIQVLNQILADEYRVLFATNGQTALTITREQKPQVILLDVMMPDMDGYQVCRELKANPETRNIPIIFITGKDQDEDEEMGFRIGAADYLTKPVRPTTVRVRVKNQLQLRRSEELILRQALYDGLTGLPNRSLAMDRLRYAILQEQREYTKTGLLFIDLDNFKTINDTLGHDAGDQVLVDAAKRLRQCIRKGDTVARLGGDEFVIILPRLKQVNDSIPVAEQILRSFTQPMPIAGMDYVISTSIGIAISPDDSNDYKQLLVNADTAMYQSKNAGRNNYHLFNEKMNQHVNRRMQMETHLHGALERGELLIYYQPIVDVLSNQVIGAEALLRWNSPQLGWVSPEAFIDIAEQTGLIGPIGAFVLEQGCRQFWNLRRADGRLLSLAVNVSPQQFRREDLTQQVKKVLQMTGMQPGNLKLEVTEGLLLGNQDCIKDALQTLHEMNIRLSMDDFGTGYSSLSYLRNFAFDLVKIDRSFIKEITQRPDDEALVTAAIAMAHGLGLEVIAEGVETQEQMALLTSKACDQIQGYLFAEPMPFDNFVTWLKEKESL
ncbi:two-component system response regulator [Candidatus Venteria ishoeyi]|uniref:cyclic-guanylate-specific phosphodiesterase n=1 Tax=Candidatus Venteria ishoeyi TaxID=1899563 RepID=A0A1H6FFG0_9GAMM|nr:GGDEF domain-containing response regulator [Candidatus Venteria ishoeyi]MDM8545071.1 EAL domain-containing protein [Candidatus Venteria ishoeyi]SEH07906.1 Cyclic di-GMP phosphodiesterase Gmr [Candidatus Venteria ishoeyi]